MKRLRRGAGLCLPNPFADWQPGPRRGRAGPRRGVALVMVLVITTIMGGIAADLENEAQVNLKAAANARDELQAHFHARSALELETFVLRFQAQVKQQLGNFLPIPLFELSTMLVTSDTISTLFTEDDDELDVIEEDPFAINEPFGDFRGQFFIEEVVDENRKVDLNTSLGVGCENLLPVLLAGVFDDPKFDPLFENIGDSRDPVRNRLEIIANIQDYSDGNNTVDPICSLTGNNNGGGAEEGRYRNFPYNARYEPKDGMFTSLAELRLVPGVNDAFMSIFAKYFTVWGSGSTGVSMRTAEPWMLKAVTRAVMSRPWTPSDEVRFNEFLTEKAVLLAVPGANLTEDIMKGLLEQVGLPVDAGRFDNLVRAKAIRFEDVASVYRISAVGVVGEATSKLSVVWRDNRSSGEIKYWRED
ncbi:MAG: hypothetical protein AAGD10_13840 [Myxococcota bacterium]